MASANGENSIWDTIKNMPPVDPAAEIIIKGSVYALNNPETVEKNEKYAGWIPFLLPMVYCRPEGWLEYWAPRLYKIGTASTEITDYELAVYDNRFDYAYGNSNEMVSAYAKWFYLETNMKLDTPDQLDSEFLDANSLKVEFIQDYLKVKIADNYDNVVNTHKSYHPDIPDLAQYILEMCQNCSLKSNEGNKKYIDNFVEDLSKKNKKVSLNPLIILATLATEKNFASDGYSNCMGIGLPGNPNQDMEDPFGDAIQIYLRNYAVGYYFYKLQFFNPNNYLTDPNDLEKRTEQFENMLKYINEFVKAGGAWGARSGSRNKIVGSANDRSLYYGPRAGVCDYDSETISGYVAEKIDKMYTSDEWAQHNVRMSLFLEGIPFLPNSAEVYARQKFNTWHYFPSGILDDNNNLQLNIGTFNSQKFYNRIKKTKDEYEKWMQGDTSWK